MATQSLPVAVGTAAPAFHLPSTSREMVSTDDFAGRRALLVAFICNHCPYVRHVERELARVAADYEQQDLATVGISANLYDETQKSLAPMARSAPRTSFLFDADRRLSYRGELDGSRPNNGVPVTGASLRAAIDLVLAGKPVPEPHRPSIGCSIKWSAPR